MMSRSPPAPRAAVAIAALLFGVTSRSDAQRDSTPARVLILFQQQAETQPMQEFTRSLRSTISQAMRARVEFFQESLDLDRFKGRERSPPLVNYFADKYRDFGIDVVVPVGARALRFAIDQLRPILPDAPIVFALNAAPQTDPSTLPPNVTGRLAVASRYAPTLELARRLQPDAERVVVIGGSGPEDSISVAAAVSGVGALRDTLPLEVLQALSLDVLLRRLRELPVRSIVIFANYRIGGRGAAFDPVDLVGSIARASRAPMYGQLRSYVGEGLVGGSVLSFDDEGVRTGRLVGRVLQRKATDPMPPVEYMEKRFVVDWRQLRRWGMPEQRLPAGSVLIFREPSAWERYGAVVLVTLGVIAAEGLLIWLLLLERGRRVRAQAVLVEEHRRAEEARSQLTHMGRVALVGELAATISHDLRQPLAAIRANAEAGAALGPSAAGSAELREIFTSIVEDDVRAVEVIQSVRRLLNKEESVVAAVDINQICRDAHMLLQHDATRRDVRLELALADTSAEVSGDPVQLQQVVINLVLNAIEAASTSAGERFVVIKTVSSASMIELVVRDSGPGIAPDVQPRLFESFFSTKSGGLGLGLVIVHSIVERHSGRIQAENHASGGAVFRVRLPRLAAPVRSAAAGPRDVTSALRVQFWS